ncbi:MAG: hypothetical protein ACKOD3_11970, partial [Phenylobacterium sp.]
MTSGPPGKDRVSPRSVKARSQRLTQYAALAWRRTIGGSPEVLLITSRETRRWITPKGWPIKGLKPHQVAAREAWE